MNSEIIKPSNHENNPSIELEKNQVGCCTIKTKCCIVIECCTSSADSTCENHENDKSFGDSCCNSSKSNCCDSESSNINDCKEKTLCCSNSANYSTLNCCCK